MTGIMFWLSRRGNKHAKLFANTMQEIFDDQTLSEKEKYYAAKEMCRMEPSIIGYVAYVALDNLEPNPENQN